MFNPISTYRIQFHKDFSFKNFKEIIPYLIKLGVKTVYASPVFESTPGSMHGYDGVNPFLINPEIGTEAELKEITTTLQKSGVSWIQDIVPNHMAYHPNNSWLMDVFRHGSKSFYYDFFDIGWESELYEGRVMAPFLGSSFDEAVSNGEIKVGYFNGNFVFQYYENVFPLSIQSYPLILNGQDSQFAELVQGTEALLGQGETYNKEWENFQQSFEKAAKANHDFTEIINKINSDPSMIHAISSKQFYQWCKWQETDYQINFRRFFTINGLICLNIQKEKVFNHYHRYIDSLLKDGIIQGVRVDHIDGLYDPAGYLSSLRKMAGPEAYIVVEKILEPGEVLPDWPIQGNTGYDFLALVNNLLTNHQSKTEFTEFYEDLTEELPSIHEQIKEKKANILYQLMAGELENLTLLFERSSLANPDEINHEQLKKSIGEVLIECPVYRFYGNYFPLPAEEKNALQKIFHTLLEKESGLEQSVLLLERTIISLPEKNDAEYNQRALKFYQRLMQFSGPLMAKGVEDTLMYTYNRFIGNNEVGDAPETFGISAAAFHEEMLKRQKHWPLSLNGTATHDTKRGEDVSAMLNVLTDIPGEWMKVVREWRGLNKSLKKNLAPDDNDEYLIYQALTGSYPLIVSEEDTFPERFTAYLQKALREAKRHSNWTAPNEAYEEGTKTFALQLLDKKRPFWKSFEKFRTKIRDYGIVNSLSKVLMKFTSPGVPDVYQGCEMWDLSLVDPDNRRQVNYKHRIDWMDQFSSDQELEQEQILDKLWQERSNANIKLWLVHALLKERANMPDLFRKGQYIPLEVQGKYSNHVFAFARRYQHTWYVVAIPLHLAQLGTKQKKDILKIDWSDTRIMLPEEMPLNWENLLEKSEGKAEKGLLVKSAFKSLPFAFLKFKLPETNRSAGILMHITSLPSEFGIGDFGPAATAFADSLARSYQKYWQLLPLNVTEKSNAYSPYSSISSVAGNTLLVSPERLVEEHLLDTNDLASYRIHVKETADFEHAEKTKEVLLEKAYRNFQQHHRGSKLEERFHRFVKEQADWLNDFAAYVRIKEEQGGEAWFNWPSSFKNRDKKTLEEFSSRFAEDILKIKWQQFIFLEQWSQLKGYCNNLGIQLFGDVPFYISYDSVDVWSNPDIFKIDKEGKMLGVAGVPPDYFNEDGQLWGMPVFNWEALKKRNYDWWMQRIRKNMELFDIVRLDHFRAFADFWEVDAAEKTAKKGTWMPGPAADFFEAVKNTFGKLPFIAEDLGDINELVHELRDGYQLPGMKVLQFAFGEDMPQSIYIPHQYNSNYVAYTGTHDNNTTVGWFRQDSNKTDRKNIELYTGIKPAEKNIHLILGRLAYASVAKVAILPLQDVLGLDEHARMNMPASQEKNWLWRLKPGQLGKKEEVMLREWVVAFNR